MTKRPWMPLYTADYLKDTQHLSTEEHGAYLLLLIAYWNAGSLPDDDDALARIAKLSRQRWARTRPQIAPFFESGWRHKRVEAELELVSKRQKVGRLAALKRWPGRLRAVANE